MSIHFRKALTMFNVIQFKVIINRKIFFIMFPLSRSFGLTEILLTLATSGRGRLHDKLNSEGVFFGFFNVTSLYTHDDTITDFLINLKALVAKVLKVL